MTQERGRRPREQWRAARHREHCHRDEGGFSILEATIALGILFSTLSLLGHQLVVGFASIAVARQREVATRIANEALEQVRALAFDQLDMGNADLASGTDPAITAVTDGSGTLVYRFRGRDIPRAEIAARPPLVPHVVTHTPGPDETRYTRSVYVTTQPGSTSRLVTVRVAWEPVGQRATEPMVEVESLVHDAHCQAQDGPRPCESYWFASADAKRGTVRVRGTVAGQAGVDASAVLGAANSQLVTEQLTTTRAAAGTAGAGLVIGAGAPTDMAGVSASAAADDSVATGVADYDAPAPAGPSGSGTLSAEGALSPQDSARLDVTVPSGSTAGVAAAAVAAGQVPPMGGGSIDNDRLGYGRARSGQAGDIVANLAVRAATGHDATTAILKAAQASEQDSVSVDRDPGPNTNISDDDEIIASASRRLGSVQLFTLPVGALPGPAWTGSLAQLTAWTSSASAVAGPRTTGSESASQTGSLSYWNGTGYTTVDLASGVVDLDVGAVATVAGCVHEIQGHLQGGGMAFSHEHTGGVETNPVIRSRGTVSSPLLGNFTYRVTCGVQVLADLTIDVDLGSTIAESRFAVPNA